MPVKLSITAVYKGDLTVGDVIVMRDLGGTAADGTTFVYFDSFRDSAWVPGASLFVFANTPTADDHSGTGITPNMVFVENNGSVRSAQDDPERMPLTEMRTRVIERWG